MFVEWLIKYTSHVVKSQSTGNACSAIQSSYDVSFISDVFVAPLEGIFLQKNPVGIVHLLKMEIFVLSAILIPSFSFTVVT